MDYGESTWLTYQRSKEMKHHLLANLALIEKTAADIYHTLYLRAKELGRHDVAAVLFQMMLDEESHYHQLQMAIVIAEKNRYVFKDEASIEKSRQLLNEIHKLYVQVMNKELSLTEIVDMAGALEDEFIDVHACAVLQFKSSRIQAIFEALSREDELHVAELDKLKKLVG